VRVRYRLTGTAVTEAYGHNFTGRWLHELDVDGGVALWTERYAELMRSRRATYCCQVARLHHGGSIKVEGIMLPLSSDGAAVDKALEVEDYDSLLRLGPEERQTAV